MSETRAEVTQLLSRSQAGDREASEALLNVVYGELHRRADRLMQREASGHTLQSTALVNEALIKLLDLDRIDWQDRGHFYAVSSRVMRRILIDHAGQKNACKRGRGVQPIAFEEGAMAAIEQGADLSQLDEALQALAEVDPRQADIVNMRFFAGLSVQEVAEALGVSKRTVESEWTMTKAWLRRQLS